MFRAFHGPVVIVKVFEDNVFSLALLEYKDYEWKVLVVDGGGSIRCALLGGNFLRQSVTLYVVPNQVSKLAHEVHPFKEFTVL